MNIKELARQAGVRDDEYCFEFSEPKYLIRFAELIAAHEREECAKVCDRFANRMMSAEECAGAIRERGKV